MEYTEARIARAHLWFQLLEERIRPAKNPRARLFFDSIAFFVKRGPEELAMLGTPHKDPLCTLIIDAARIDDFFAAVPPEPGVFTLGGDATIFEALLDALELDAPLLSGLEARARR